MTIELKKNDIKTLKSLVTQEIDRIGEAKERYGLGDLSYFYHLVDMRNNLLAMTFDTEVPLSFSDKECQEFLGGKGG